MFAAFAIAAVAVWIASGAGGPGPATGVDPSTLATGDRAIVLEREHTAVSFRELASFEMSERRPSDGEAGALALVPASVRRPAGSWLLTRVVCTCDP
jgi:hypothetical protein